MRKCSYCAHNGHNSRTCPNRGPKLFGVRLMGGGSGGIRKSASMGNLGGLGRGHYEGNDHGEGADGYASEDFVPGSSSACCDRKKGVPWTEEEHRKFLVGLKKLGKGDWKGISRNFVVSRTPTQVASHAQKYFIRQSNVSRRKRRSSLFDIVADECRSSSVVATSLDDENLENPPLPEPPSLEEECESMDSTNPSEPEVLLPSPASYPVALPTFFPPISPFPSPFWSGYRTESLPVKEMHEIIKPTPVHLKAPIDIDQLLGISKLNIGESIGEPMLDLSLKLNGASDRQSAFHANLSTRRSAVHSNSSPVPAM